VLQEVLGYGSYPMLSVAYFEQHDYDLNSRIFNPNNLNSWSFVLVDEFDQIIDLNGVSWGLSIVLYDRSDTHEVLKTDLEFRNEERLIELTSKESELKNIIEETPVEPPRVFTGADMPIAEGENLEPLFPVKPFFSSAGLAPPATPVQKSKPKPDGTQKIKKKNIP
jgi:hypothetical protein